MPSSSVICKSLKNEATWYRMLEGFYAPNTIQLREYSMGSGTDGILYKSGRMPMAIATSRISTGMASAGT